MILDMILKDVGWNLYADTVINLQKMTKHKHAVSHLAKEKVKKKKIIRKANHSNLSEKVSEDIYDTLHDIAANNDFVEIHLISTAMRSNKWINYAIYYMTHETNLLKVDKATREFVNAITDLAGFGKIYTSAGIADLSKYDVDNTDRIKNGRFIISYSDLRRRITNPEFVEKMKLNKLRVKGPDILGIGVNQNSGKPSSYQGQVDNQGYIHPIFIANQPFSDHITVRNNGVDPDEFKLLENALSSLITDEAYMYSKMPNGLIQLSIERDNTFGARENFTIDNGTLLGGRRIYVMGTFITPGGTEDTIFVDAQKHPSIAYKILQALYYRMSVDEVTICLQDLMANGAVYTYIDFSNTPWLDYLTATQKEILASKLIDIVRSMALTGSGLATPPRLRFAEFVSESDFMLVSDTKVISPFADTGATSPDICEGLAFVVKGGVISEYFNNKEIGIPSSASVNYDYDYDDEVIVE